MCIRDSFYQATHAGCGPMPSTPVKPTPCDRSSDDIAGRGTVSVTAGPLVIGNASVLLGAGRIKKEDSIDFAAGIIMHKKLGDAVKAGEPICTLYADDDTLFAAAEEMYVGGLTIGAEKPEVPPLIYARVTSEGVERF